MRLCHLKNAFKIRCHILECISLSVLFVTQVTIPIKFFIFTPLLPDSDRLIIQELFDFEIPCSRRSELCTLKLDKSNDIYTFAAIFIQYFSGPVKSQYQS